MCARAHRIDAQRGWGRGAAWPRAATAADPPALRISSLADLWLGSDAVTNELEASLSSDPVLAVNVTLQRELLTGYFGLRPSSAEGEPAYEEFAARMAALAPTLPAGGGNCSLDVDDDGATAIFAGDHDGDASTPLACAGTPALSASDIDGLSLIHI